ncbi:hypothetical protein [Kiritimatiella glycovorans]|nr:hypothetical protein [Kiritimatiella glycovorans]
MFRIFRCIGGLVVDGASVPSPMPASIARQVVQSFHRPPPAPGSGEAL